MCFSDKYERFISFYLNLFWSNLYFNLYLPYSNNNDNQNKDLSTVKKQRSPIKPRGDFSFALSILNTCFILISLSLFTEETLRGTYKSESEEDLPYKPSTS